MLTLPKVTLCCISTVDHFEAVDSILRSIKHIEFAEVIFLTDFVFLDNRFKSIVIDSITSVEQYSFFCLKELYKYINTDHVLIIQPDSCVTNVKKWSNDFLKYDYIGAPWWYDDKHNVGNGGFSLRSKKLLLATTDPHINDTHPEDDRICRMYRDYLEEKYSLKWAPEYLAVQFSFEGNKKYHTFQNQSFGIHGRVTKDLIKIM